jgi:uncharacterized protein (DUF1330 family)
MPAYVIAEVEIQDAAAYEEYRKQVPGTIAAYGGKYLARGGKVEVVEGNRAPARMVILEFPTLAQAKAWYDSPEYRPVRAIRHRTAKSHALIIEGL